MTDDLPDEAVFLKSLQHSSTRPSMHQAQIDRWRSAHCNKRLSLELEVDYVVVKVALEDLLIIFCCFYIPSKTSHYRWEDQDLLTVIGCLDNKVKEEQCNSNQW